MYVAPIVAEQPTFLASRVCWSLDAASSYSGWLTKFFRRIGRSRRLPDR